MKHIKPVNHGIGNLMDTKHLPVYPRAPKHDHTTGNGGYFLFMNQMNDQNTAYETDLIINNLPKVDFKTAFFKEKCVNFAFQIVGNADLRVFVDEVSSSLHGFPIFETTT